jgi:hypothetical protein
MESGGGSLCTGTVNKQAGGRRLEPGVAAPPPVCLERERLVIAAKAWHTPLESGRGAPPQVNSK